MGKHLTIEEKHNAKNELIENRDKIKQLREQINVLKRRNDKLLYYLNYAKRSKYEGMAAEQGFCYQKYGKKKSELTLKETREYNKLKQREHRLNKQTKE